MGTGMAGKRAAAPPLQALLDDDEHVASTAELNDLLDALAADRAFSAAVAHATTGGLRHVVRTAARASAARLVAQYGLFARSLRFGDWGVEKSWVVVEKDAEKEAAEWEGLQY